MRHFFCALVFCALAVSGLRPVAAQSTAGYGDWQLHLPADRAFALADAGDRLYVATDASVFYLDKKLQTTRLLSRRDGLNDVGVGALAFDSVGRQTVLAYRNGNIDVLRQDGTVRNLPDVVRKNVQGSKVIYQVSTGQGRAFISTSFGLLNIDLAKLEVQDTYSNIGVGGRTVQVFSAAVWRDTLYAATDDGLLRGALQTNLLDYRNWIREPNPASGAFRLVAVHRGHVYALVNNDGLYRLSGPAAQRRWQAVPGLYSAFWRQLRSTGSGLYAVAQNQHIQRFNHITNTFTAVLPASAVGDALDVAPQADGSIFVASFDKGLLKLLPNSGQAAERFVPNGPASNSAFGLLADARTNTVDVFSGGFADRYLQRQVRNGFYEYQNGQWTNVTRQTYSAAEYPDLFDVSRGTRTPDGTLYVASYGEGLLEWHGPGKFRHFTQGTPGSPLRSALPDNKIYTRVTDVAADPEGNVWVVNRHQVNSTSGLFVFKPATTEWEIIPYFSNSQNLDRIALDDNGVAWVSEARAGGAGIWAVDRAGKLARHFTTANGLPSNEIYDLAKDRRGLIWVATIDGLAVSDDPALLTDPSTAFAFREPIVRRGEASNFPALFHEAVRCIAVDGGNRKWFGTDTGLWLFSEDADEALLHFTTANSPLPSNRVVDVAVNDKTGEVFVATDAGLVSYRGSATITEGKPSCVQAFPNPVRPDFRGQVGINGLANNAVVKITDVTGKLVYSTRASGGTVTWNLADANGRRVRSGVYLVLSSDADGKNGCISKVAVL